MLLALILAFMPTSEPKEKTIDVFFQKKDDSFFLTLNHPYIRVKNSVDNIAVGYDLFGNSGIYLESKETVNAMLFFHHYNTKNKYSDTNHVIIEFGGVRDSDIHIYIPKGYKSKLELQSVKK